MSMTEEIVEIEDPDPGPSVKVYADGRVVVHFPAYMKRAGDYETVLTADELEALVSGLSNQLAGFDEEAARRKAAHGDAVQRTWAAGNRTPELLQAPDATNTKITVKLTAYEPRGLGPAIHPVDAAVTWRGLNEAARRHPDVQEIQGLAVVRRDLLALMERPDLSKAP